MYVTALRFDSTDRYIVSRRVEDYPRDLAEFEARFATDAACRAYLVQFRWPEEFRCPRCRHAKAWVVRAALFQCAACGRQTSVTAGTIFQDLRTALRRGFAPCGGNQKTGASAPWGLQRTLGLRSYETAWTWSHKLRRAMVRPGRDRLTGRVALRSADAGVARGSSTNTPQHRRWSSHPQSRL